MSASLDCPPFCYTSIHPSHLYSLCYVCLRIMYVFRSIARSLIAKQDTLVFYPSGNSSYSIKNGILLLKKKKMLLIELRGSQVYWSHEGGIFLFNGKVRYNCYKKASWFEEKQHECKWYVGRKCPHLCASNWRQKGSMEPRDSIRENIPGAFRLPPFLIRAARRWVEQQLLRIFQRKCWELLQVDFSFLNFDIMKTICHMAKLSFLSFLI